MSAGWMTRADVAAVHSGIAPLGTHVETHGLVECVRRFQRHARILMNGPLTAGTSRGAVSVGGSSSMPRKPRLVCKRGHAMTPENTYYPPKRPGVTECRECRVIVASEYLRPCQVDGCTRRYHSRGYCVNHYRSVLGLGVEPRRPRPSSESRFWSLVDKSAGEVGCWPYLGTIVADGHGRGRYAGRYTLAHRYSWELLKGPIPAGLHLDHTCHTNDLACDGGVACPHRRCVNPAHLEPVAPSENTRRGRSARSQAKRGRDQTHCLRGHEYTPENTYRWKGGWRKCRTCHRESERVNRVKRGVAA